MQLNELARAGGDVDYQKLAFDYARHPTRTPPRRCATRWWWSAPGRSAWRWPSTWRSAACRWCCWTTTTRCPPARAPSASPSARWRSSTASAAATAWSPRACRGTSARCSSRTSRSTSFDLLPEAGHARPAFINLQQYYVEGYLAERAAQLPLIDLRWKNKVVGVEQHADHVAADRRDARRPLPPRRPTTWPPATARARALRQLHRPGEQGPRLPRPLPDRRREDEGRLPGRALVLVRPAVPSEPERAAAQAARRRLAHRLPARLGRRSRGGEEAREHHPARQGAARARR